MLTVNRNEKQKNSQGRGMKRIAIKSVLVISLMSVCLSSYATLPVFDYTAAINFIVEFQKLKQQYKLLNQTYNNAIQRLTEAKTLVKDSEGHYGFGSLDNSAADLKQREWSPSNWQDALKGLSGGNAARYQQLLSEYKKNHHTLSQTDFAKGAGSARALNYNQQVQTNQAAAVQTSYAFNDVQQHLQSVHQLSAQIEQAKNTKAAVDLNSRLLTELAYISVQELKMQTLMNQQLAQQSASNISAETQNASFNELPKK